MNDKINITELKKIVKEIENSESKKYGLDIKIIPISYVNLFDSNFKIDTDYSLDKRMSDYSYYFSSGGYNDEKGIAVVFVDCVEKRIKSLKDIRKIFTQEAKYDLVQSYNKITNNELEYLKMEADRKDGYLYQYKGTIVKDLFHVIKVSYHEARHSVQRTFDRYSYERFLYDIEHFFIEYFHIDYDLNHDDYSFEIGANLYGTNMAKEYLKKNYPQVYEKDKEAIKAIETKYTKDYMLYNPTYTLNKVLPWIRILNSFGNNDIIKRDFIKNTSPVLSIFLNGDGSFKRPSEVMNNENYQTLDKRIIYTFFSNLSFLKEIKYMNDLSSEEISIINESMDYTSELFNNQMKYYNNKLAMIPSNHQKEKLIYMKLYFTKYKDIKKYLGSIKKDANSRSRGFLSIYLLSLIMSIGTIIYLYIKK